MWNFLPALIGAGASVASSNQQSQAIDKATAAQGEAADQQLQMYRDAQTNSQAILGKYSASGDAARSRMMAFLRLPQSSATAGSQPLTYSSFAGGANGTRPDGSLPTPLSTANGGLPSVSQMITGGNDPSLYNAISNGNISNRDWWATGGPSLAGQALSSMFGISGRGDGGSAVDQWGTPQENAAEADGFDGAGYLRANPDVQRAFNTSSDRDSRYIGTSFDFDGNGRIDQNEYGAWHYQTYGKNEGRAAPGAAPADATGAPGTALGGAAAATQTPDEAYEEAWAEYEQTPWGRLAQTTADQARDDFTSMAGAQGSTLSGRTARGMAEVANEAKLGNFNQYYTALGGLADQGFQADTGIASAGQTYANSASNVLAANANAQASGALARGQAQADGMGDLASWIGWGMGNWGSMGGSPSSTSGFSPSSPSVNGGSKTSGLSRIR